MEQTNLSSEVPEGTGELATTLPTDEPMPTSVAETPSASPALGQIAEPIKKREGKVDIMPKGQIRFYATGRRKEAIARVWLIPGGTGQVTVNGRPLLDYVTRLSLAEEVLTPLRVTNTLGLFDVWATVRGGGLHGQAGALRHGIARALVVWNEEMRPLLRKYGLLTRDPRAKERKKYGHKRARRGFQFRKR
jgi:small subunit ribosomal protein S9